MSVILLTGATRGLGRALVPHFVNAGHTVVGCGRSQKHVDELTKEYGQIHSFHSVDVSSDSAVQAWAKKVITQFGPADLLINNAALMNNPAPLWKISAAEFDSLFDVNVKGVANVIRAFVPSMVQRKSGVIVNLSSGWGRSTSAEVAPYCSTKYAIEGLTLALAKELPQGMAAIPLNPGVINTEMLRQCWSGGANSFPSPEDWAKQAAPFILGLQAKHNGQSLSVG
jgi:NAD(P)-dependent dehydrogenase (short-subunit alcohol dehydrogenase family)